MKRTADKSGTHVPLLDEVVDPAQTGKPKPPPNLDLFPEQLALLNQAQLREALAEQLHAWLNAALPEIMQNVHARLLSEMEQRLEDDLPDLINKTFQKLYTDTSK